MTFVLTCKFSAYDFFLFLKETSCKAIKKWVKLSHPKLPKNIAKSGSEKTANTRKMLLQVVNAFLTTAIADYKKEFRPPRASVTKGTRSRSRDFRSNRSSQSSNMAMHQHYTNSVPTPMSHTSKLPLAVPPGYNQTPLYSKAPKLEALGATAIEGESNMSFSFGTENSQPYKQLFQKKDLKDLFSMRGFTEFVALACSAVRDGEERKEITMLLDTLISTVQSFKDRELYDSLALRYAEAGVFEPLLASIERQEETLSEQEHRQIAKILELCACHQAGIAILEQHIDMVVNLLRKFLCESSNTSSKIKFPAATVLLDLTANEACIEKVAVLVKELNMFSFILSELTTLMNKTANRAKYDQLPKGLARYKDLLVGILLNLSCNVENEDVSEFMMRQGLVRMLRRYALLAGGCEADIFSL